MRFTLYILILLILGCDTNKPSQTFNNFEIGTWKFESEEHCSEIYTFNTDNTFDVISEEQRVTSKYQLTASKNNFYKLFYETTYYNGKPSCMGVIDTTVGEKITVYLKFNQHLDQMEAYFLPKDSESLGIVFKRIK